MPTPPDPDSLDIARHADGIRRVARSLVYQDADVEDVVQETLRIAVEAPPPKGWNIRAWLAGVARNVARNLLRGERRRRTRHALAARDPAVAADFDAVARIEEKQILLRSVRALAEPYRTAILLRYFEDLSPPALAARLGVPVATAKTRLRRGLHLLRDEMDRAHGGSRRPWVLALLPVAGPPRRTLRVGPIAAAASVVVGVGAWVAYEGARSPPAAETIDLATADRRERPPSLSAAGRAPSDPFEDGRGSRDDAADVVGRVFRRSDGTPVDGARVAALRLSSALEAHRTSADAYAIADSSGRFSIRGVAPGSWVVIAFAPGLATERLVPGRAGYNPHVVTLAAGRRMRRDVGMVPSRTAQGTVRGPGGDPIPGAMIVVSPRDKKPTERLAAFDREHAWAYPRHVERSDAQGRFRIDDLSRELGYRAEVADESLAAIPSEFEAGASLVELEFRFAASRFIDVSAYDGRPGRNDQALSGATVTAHRHDEPPFGYEGAGSNRVLPGTWTTDGGGHARVGPVPDAAITITVEHHGLVEDGPDPLGAAGSVQRTWPSGRVDVAGGVTSCRVSCGESASTHAPPKPHSPPRDVRLRAPDGSEIERFIYLAASGSLWTGPSPAPLQWETRPAAIEVFGYADRDGHELLLAPRVVDLPREGPVVVDLGIGRRLSGTVRRADGTPLDGAVVVARPTRWLPIKERIRTTSFWGGPPVLLHARAWTSQSGAFVFEALRDEAYVLEVIGDASDVGGPFHVAAADRSASLRMEAAVDAVVSVIDGRGAPAQGVELAVPRESGDLVRRVARGDVESSWLEKPGDEAVEYFACVRTGDDGVARLARLDPRGGFELAVHVLGVTDSDANVVLPGWKPTREPTVVRIGYAKGTRLVVEADAAFEGRGRLVAEGDVVQQREASLHDGRWVFDDVRPDRTYRVCLGPNAGRCALMAGVRGDTGTLRVPVAAMKPTTVRLRLKSDVTHAEVSPRDPLLRQWHRASAAGEAILELPPGRHRVVATAHTRKDGRETWVTEDAEVEAGERLEIDLTD